MIDLHSHILPGIDDGAATLEDAMILVTELVAAGVTDVVATPHYVEETIYTAPASKNRKLMAKLQEAVTARGLDIKIHLGNEIYICKRIDELVKSGEVASLSGSKYLLVELPMSGDFPNYRDILLELLRAGYKVVLAHPERYTSFARDFALVEELFDMGVLLQCNVGSFAGQYGKTVRKLAVKLAKNKMIFGVGTDIHHPHGEDFVPAALKKMGKYYSEAELLEILETNPRKILGA